MDNSINKLFNYYYEIALRSGLEEPSDTRQPTNRQYLNKHQAPYSVAPFYRKLQNDIRKNRLSRYQLLAAFLGDDRARTEVVEQIENSGKTFSDKELAPFFSQDAPLGSDAEQLKAVSHSLTQPLTIIQGPPGTGKTQTIVNIASCIQGLCIGEGGRHPTIAIVSTNNDAVKNAIEGIKRLTRSRDDNNAHPLSAYCAMLGSRDRRKKFAKSMDDATRAQLGIDDLGDSCQMNNAVLSQFPIFGSTLHSLYKCFDGEDVDEFDYVIVDEGSQVPNYLGLIALRYAHHLIVLGDTEQIPPIIKQEQMKGIELDGIEEFRRDQEGNSFILTCERVFNQPIGSKGNIMLRRHYRCHPGIIGFNNEYIYACNGNERSLIPLAPDANGSYITVDTPDCTPIRIIWYEGAYFERLGDCAEKKSNGADEAKRDRVRPKVHNMRQVNIFLKEELERAMGKVAEGKSVCILSPYRPPVDWLAEHLRKLDAAGTCPVVERMHDERYSQELFQLTIHRAQGKAYDVVYYLSIDDYDSKKQPWGQKKCHINVAVSRAREEFCAIVSSVWLPAEFAVETGAFRPEDGWDYERNANVDSNYLTKLLRYVYDNRQTATGEYGFHRARTKSVFDIVPRLRKAESRPEESAPQKCMRLALNEMFEGTEYTVEEEVLVKRVFESLGAKKKTWGDEELESYLNHSCTKFDFAIKRGGEYLMAIEVDGERHREQATSIANDVKKNRIVSEFMGGALYGARSISNENRGNIDPMEWEGLCDDTSFALVRIPTNGETVDEAELITELLNDLQKHRSAPNTRGRR